MPRNATVARGSGVSRHGTDQHPATNDDWIFLGRYFGRLERADESRRYWPGTPGG